MAGKLSFSIAINLLTENFKRGTNQVKAAFRSMQMQFLTFAAALGAGGLGLSNFVSRLIEVSRETNRVTTSLKNVSGSMAQYADNQRYLISIAKKYGLEINALTGNFAKFTAAASISGMAMGEQRKIFESVSRACTAFGMSADDSNGVFLALSQMMSKGKISSEELRLQMGERLPVAIQAMAKAAGVSVGQLDKLLKQGKLMSADVLPKFAQALDELIPNVDTDNLETSINKLKNTFTEFANGAGIQSKYKALVDWLTELVQSAGDNIKSIITYTIAAILVMITSNLVNKIIGAIARAGLAAKSEARAAAKAAGVAFDEAAWKAQKASASIKMAFTRAMRSIRTAFISAIPTAIITIVGALIARLVDLNRESKRIKSIFSDYKKEAEGIGNTQEVQTLRTQLSIMNDKHQSMENINGAQRELQRMLEVEHKSQADLNVLVAKRVKLLEETARAEFHAQKIPEIEAKNHELEQNFRKDYGGKSKYSMKDMLSDVDRYGYRNKSGLPIGFRTKYGLSGTETGIRQVLDEFFENLKSIAYSKNELLKSTVNANSLNKNTVSPLGGDGEPDDKKSELQKQEEKYAQSIRELNARREVEKMSLDDYNKAYDELNRNALIEAKASTDKEVLTSKYLQNLQKSVDNPLFGSAQAELTKVNEDYIKATSLAKSKLDRKLITEDEYRKAISDAAISAAESALSIDGIGNAANEYVKNLRIIAISQRPAPVLETRDTTYDYKKSKSEIASDELEVAKKNLEILREEAKQLGVEMTDGLSEAIKKIPDLEKALKIAVVIEDVKALRKELNESVYSGVKDIASSADRMVSAFENLKDVMNDVDASGWERIMAVWNAMTNVVDSFLSIIQMIENLTEITNKLSLAKETEVKLTQEATGAKLVEGAVDTTVTGQKVVNAAIGEAVDKSASQTKVTTAATNIVANTAEGASEAGKGASKLPFPWNLVAMGAAIAGAIALFATLPKFANGGIFTGGTPTGDNGLARLNKGEMILNMGQQSKLFRMLNSGSSMSKSQNVNIGFDRVKGSDIYLSLSNYMKSTGKKL